MKQAINWLKLGNVLLSDAKTCYFKLRDELEKDGSEPQTLKLSEYKKTDNKKMLKNTTPTSQRNFIDLVLRSNRSLVI